MGMGWGLAERVNRKQISKAFYQDLPSPLGMGTESEPRSQQLVCYCDGAGGDYIWNRGRRWVRQGFRFETCLSA